VFPSAAEAIVTVVMATAKHLHSHIFTTDQVCAAAIDTTAQSRS
jgi:hypothetical protein